MAVTAAAIAAPFGIMQPDNPRVQVSKEFTPAHAEAKSKAPGPFPGTRTTPQLGSDRINRLYAPPVRCPGAG
jgi:hypothetical protein